MGKKQNKISERELRRRLIDTDTKNDSLFKQVDNLERADRGYRYNLGEILGIYHPGPRYRALGVERDGDKTPTWLDIAAKIGELLARNHILNLDEEVRLLDKNVDNLQERMYKVENPEKRDVDRER